MSFSGAVKEELSAQIGVARHCRVAELAALTIFGTGEEKSLSADRPEVGEKRERLLRLLRVRSARQVLGGGSTPDTAQILRRDCCRRTFLRGAFLAAGTISDPDRSYHFEILCGTETSQKLLAETIQRLQVDARCVRRKKYYVVYVKESEQIAQLLGLMGANVALLSFENARVVKEVRGNVNRKVNCETANINKTANAAAGQIEDIRFLQEKGVLAAVGAGLDETAALRLQYPEATLEELGRMMDPPIGKSGVNHRLRKLRSLATELRDRQ